MNKQEIEENIAILKSMIPEYEMRNRMFGVKALRSAISALEHQLTNGWIPVSERLPTDEESKLCRGGFIIQTKDCELPYVALWNRIKGIWQDDYEELNDVIA